MISYLLSGWRVYVPDENGHPLYRGRVYFYDASTSQPSTVYADKGQVTALGTYVDVDNNGYIPAIWLDASHLYKVVVKRLIQADPETWNTLWEINDVGNPFLTSEEITGKSTIAVNTISDLKALNPLDSGRPDYVYVMGWFAPGDTGSPMLFRWVPNASGNDGHWIEPNTTGIGAWEQLFEVELDPRKFGAVPNSGNACDTSIYNCMMYACEPHSYDSSDTTPYAPRTVRFVESGTYKLNSAFDFTQYTMISQYFSKPVPVVIGENVYFDKQVTVGQDARIDSSQVVAAPLVVKPDSMEYVRPQWFSGNVISGIFAGIQGGNNVKVYQVADNLNRSFLGGIVIGSDDDRHWVEFCDDSFLIDTDTATAPGPMTFKCIVKADKFKSLIKKPTRSVSTSEERADFKAVNPIKMVHKYQTVSDYWFGIGLLTASDPLDDYKGLLLSWCANCGALNYDLVGGYDVNVNVAFVSSYDADLGYVKHSKVKIERPLTVTGATISNFILDEVGEKVFHDGGSGLVSLLNGNVYADWFGGIDGAESMCANKSCTLTGYGVGNYSVNGTAISFSKLHGMSVLVNGNTGITVSSNDVSSCSFAINGFGITFDNTVKISGCEFSNGIVYIADNDDTRKSTVIENNVFELGSGRDLSIIGITPTEVKDRSLVICGNSFVSGDLVLGSSSYDWEQGHNGSIDDIVVSNNRGCGLSTETYTQVRNCSNVGVDAPQLLYLATRSGGSWSSTVNTAVVRTFAVGANYWSRHCMVKVPYDTNGDVRNVVIVTNSKSGNMARHAYFTAGQPLLTNLQSDVSNDGTFLLKSYPGSSTTNSDIYVSGDISSSQFLLDNGSYNYSNTNVIPLEITYLPSVGGYYV